MSLRVAGAVPRKTSFAFICLIFTEILQGSSVSASHDTPRFSKRTFIPRGGTMATIEPNTETGTALAFDVKRDDILVVFSDLDGTLLHYPKTIPKSSKLLKLPPSSTGMRGVISPKTLRQVQEIRSKDVKFALVSGMRTTTMLTRMPYLPRADAYCSEAGGRIFYPTSDLNRSSFVVTPKWYDGCNPNDLEPFGLIEDLEWRKKMEKSVGEIGGRSLTEMVEDPKSLPGLEYRDGRLWDFARFLTTKGYVLDIKGYEACFRVNRKQQTSAISDDDMKALTDGRIEPWEGLSTSVNLSCVDYYPDNSGKKNCCEYLAKKWHPKYGDDVLSINSVCLCDDDNDLEMALACSHAYIPELSSESMAETIAEYPSKFTQTGGEGADHEGPEASEEALRLILEKML